MGLLGPNGLPMQTYKKSSAPKLGPAYGDWAGRDVLLNQMPGAGVLQFNLDALTLADFRAMRDHPQINASLTVLTFMMHGLDWKIKGPTAKISNMIEDNLREVWTRMVRAMSQAFWAGYSPIVIEWDNDTNSNNVIIDKFKDLVPEECVVNWKYVLGAPPRPGGVRPKFKQYNGIRHRGYQARLDENTNFLASNTAFIPPENTLWYPLLMENGNYYGKKLLRASFASWYYSILIHLFANRYFERFGEPTPIGRAPFSEIIETGDPNQPTITGKAAMENILANLRSRGVVVLPNDRVPIGNTSEWEYDIEYLESQMRGADFDRYLDRLDEEMSLSLFTPVLMFRSGQRGSYNLGVQQAQVFLWMLNSIAGDMKEYIDRYVVAPLRDFNFGPQVGRVEWVPRKMGDENVETIRAIIQALINRGTATVDLDELGVLAGLTVKEVQQVTMPPPAPGAVDPVTGQPKPPSPAGPPAGPPDARVRVRPGVPGPRGVGQPRATGRQISNRVRSQVENAFAKNIFGPGFKASFGFERRFEDSLVAEGLEQQDAQFLTSNFFQRIELWMEDAVSLGQSEYGGPQDFMSLFDRLIDSEVDRLVEYESA